MIILIVIITFAVAVAVVIAVVVVIFVVIAVGVGVFVVSFHRMFLVCMYYDDITCMYYCHDPCIISNKAHGRRNPQQGVWRAKPPKKVSGCGAVGPIPNKNLEWQGIAKINLEWMRGLRDITVEHFRGDNHSMKHPVGLRSNRMMSKSIG